VAHYLDTSAAVKLVVKEPETAALRRWLRSHDELVSSDITRTELLRVTRLHAPQRVAAARAVLDALHLLAITTDVCERAALLEPRQLRSLDALHLASALQLGDDLDGIVVYDRGLADAASDLAIPVVAPS
jgi:predicted nucleic acid-binding protein